MNIISIFIVLALFGNIYTKNVAAKIQKHYLEIDDHNNSDIEKSFGNKFDEKKKPKSKLTSAAAKDLKNPICPDIEVISPCSCSITFDNNNIPGVAMDCSNVTTELELETIFEKSFPQNDMHIFFMNQQNISSDIGELPLGVFGSKTFSNVGLYLINFNFSFNSFAHMNATLHSFWVHSAPIYEINHNFNAYAELSHINLYDCPLTDFIISSPTLKVLELRHTNITEKADNKPYSLGPMPNLKELNIAYGNLHKMPDTSGYSKLELFTLYENHISSNDVQLRTENYLSFFKAGKNDFQDIAVDSIRMSQHSQFHMEENQIQNLNEDKWRNIFLNASVINLQGNPLECSCVMAWMFGKDNNGIVFMDKLLGEETCKDGVLLLDLKTSAYDIC